MDRLVWQPDTVSAEPVVGLIGCFLRIVRGEEVLDLLGFEIDRLDLATGWALPFFIIVLISLGGEDQMGIQFERRSYWGPNRNILHLQCSYSALVDQ